MGCANSKLVVEPEVMGALSSSSPAPIMSSAAVPQSTFNKSNRKTEGATSTSSTTPGPAEEQQSPPKSAPSTTTPLPATSSSQQPAAQPPDPPGATPSTNKATAQPFSAPVPPSSQPGVANGSQPPAATPQGRLVGRIRGKKGRGNAASAAGGSAPNGSHHQSDLPAPYGSDSPGRSLGTRARGDSWAQGDHHPRAAVPPKQQQQQQGTTVEQQWNYLWTTQSPYLLDPADVPSCLGMLRSRITNQLSATEVTFVQRRIRLLFKQMAHNVSTQQNQSTANKLLVGRVFSSGAVGGGSGGGGGNAGGGGGGSSAGGGGGGGDLSLLTTSASSSSPATLKADTESIQLAQQQHLLSAHVIQKLWKHIPTAPLVWQPQPPPPSSPPIPPPSGGFVGRARSNNNNDKNNNSNNNKNMDVSVLENVYVLLLYLSESLWSRMANVARQTAETANLDMDVNHHANTLTSTSTSPSIQPAPKPSIVPDLTGAPPLPAGVQFQTVCCLMALALRGTRNQRLQLLFYLALPSVQLREFLDTHPAGGVPCWLWEVEQAQVISLASLTHYHYFGTAFLPNPPPSPDDDRNQALRKNFAPRKVSSRRFNDADEDDDDDNDQTEEDDNNSSPTRKKKKSKNRNGNHDPPAAGGGKNTKSSSSSASSPPPQPPFVRSQSRVPLTVPANAVRTLMQQLLFPDRGDSELVVEERTSAPMNQNNASRRQDARSPSPGRRQSAGGKFRKRMSNKDSSSNNDKSINPDGSYKMDGSSSGGVGGTGSLFSWMDDPDSNNNNYDDIAFPPTDVMRYIQNFEYWASFSLNVDADYDDIDLTTAATKLNVPSSGTGTSENDTTTTTSSSEPQVWTLEEFKHWADQELDNVALDACFYRLFGSGVLPSFSMERDLVQAKWKEWQSVWYDKLKPEQQSQPTDDKNDTNHSNGVTNGGVLKKETMLSERQQRRVLSSVWGGLGGIDGGGGTGYGILYCVDRQWWNDWVAYTGLGVPGKRRQTLIRPGDMSTESLLEKDFDVHIPGSLGSYQLMKLQPSTADKYDVPSATAATQPDYLLLPPGVWDVLYEIYGGGPPLPRMVLPPSPNNGDHKSSSNNIKATSATPDAPQTGGAIQSKKDGRLSNQIIDFKLNVAIRPWIIHCAICDPLQPYRRGDAGSFNIRIMALPDQPLWRLFGEIVVRFPLQAYKAYDADGRGMGRLWKKVDPNTAGGNNSKEPVWRYGPWNLVCKNRSAMLVSKPDDGDLLSFSLLEDLKANWKVYTDNATVESCGLANGDQLMFEFAVMSKAGKLMWPREAAAKAGRVRRLAEEDTEFRYMLQGLDREGNIMIRPPRLVGLDVDAMDSTGRWYLVQILDVDIVDEDTDEENEEFENNRGRTNDVRARKKVKVEFNKEHGHIEWIDVDSDRLAKAGRFTNEAEQQDNSSSDLKAHGGANAGKESDINVPASPAKANKGSVVTVKKSSSVESNLENMRLCSYPGFGACGLTNLGNTCYANSAVQCISYMPLLRSYLLSAQYKTTGDLNKDNPLGTGGRLLEEFADLLRAMWSAKTGEKMPKNFRHKLGHINSQFSGGDQQDAQEFLNYMMDVLHEDSNRVRRKPFVEALEDDWVAKTDLPRVGDEAWRRFLRRNDSIMAEVAMGQVLNTVTCPVCKYSSRNFDPFNLLSIPVPTVADVIFQCIVIRRATAVNTPWTLNKPRKGENKTSTRFSRSRNSKSSVGPPSEGFIAEQYVIAMSRLADSSDLRHRIQKVCGIPGLRLRLCRAEVVVVNNEASEDSVVRTQTKIFPMTEKEGPCSHLARKKAPHEDVAAPTLIVAFESTLRPRPLKQNGNERTNSKEQEVLEDTADEDEEAGATDTQTSELLPTPKVEKMLRKYLDVYGDDKECRVVDSDPLALAKALSRSLWPRDEADLKLGLRVDAKDKRGNWFQGSVVEIVDHEVNDNEVEVNEQDADRQYVVVRREVVVHFDNFAKKWDETYTMEHFEEGRVRPLYSHAIPKMKPTDFLVHHRYISRETGKKAMFGQPFYVQCYSEWSNARAGAQILAQASRFLQYSSDWSSPLDLNDPLAMDRETKLTRLYEKTQAVISELIDLLIDCDRDYIKRGLGLTTDSNEAEEPKPFRNPSFDVTNVSVTLVKKVNALLERLPFELRVAGIEAAQNPNCDTEEEIFPFSLVRTIGNFLNARQIIVLHWRDHATNDRNTGSRGEFIFYVPLPIEIEESGQEILRKSQKAGKERAKRTKPGSTGIELGVCLTEFCKSQSLTMEDNWRCPRCKDFREGRQHMNLWRLPDLLTFHIKRFNMSARWREKISTRVNFPLTGLDLSEWCHQESPVIQEDSPDSYVYDLIAVMNHYGSMTGGHYVATCKATACGKDGREEVAYDFNGLGTTLLETEGTDTTTGWRLGGRAKAAEANQGKEFAAMASRAAAESAEPLWLQFDDELVDPIQPRQVVSEMAYVLFYRRRRITPSNIAKYSTLE